ncbi:protein-L-isoaspartate O-methyltransferase family protein [Agrococcus baldri]|uniref:Protein-L-isoaspartate O-methyltransferase n=1 Tax=Agrococcus baldri TaxID=153730 RepID=A0AA87URW3_9MICO|nr:methyltransferase domain-containing protein [Agrococcus baldri]GEK80431.1 fibrillarin-like rRNA methylase [Agrococcus baldri]
MGEPHVTPTTAERVRAAMRAADRRAFLPPSVRHLADVDRPVGIGWDATNSQPSTVARMLELLDAQPGQRALDVGAGSGWTTAILAALGAAVTGVELVPQLVEQGRANLAAHAAATGGTPPPIVQAREGVLGLPDEGPWDRILVSADFGRTPDALVAQLAEGGRLVAPVAGDMQVVELREGRPRVRIAGAGYAFVPLR